METKHEIYDNDAACPTTVLVLRLATIYVVANSRQSSQDDQLFNGSYNGAAPLFQLESKAASIESLAFSCGASILATLVRNVDSSTIRVCEIDKPRKLEYSTSTSSSRSIVCVEDTYDAYVEYLFPNHYVNES